MYSKGFAGLDVHNCPDPFNAIQRESIAEDVRRVTERYKDPIAQTYELGFVLATWSARAARKYASDRNQELREEVVKLVTERVCVVLDGLLAEVTSLRSTVEDLNARLQRYERLYGR
jgi:hypothetical protein